MIQLLGLLFIIMAVIFLFHGGMYLYLGHTDEVDLHLAGAWVVLTCLNWLVFGFGFMSGMDVTNTDIADPYYIILTTVVLRIVISMIAVGKMYIKHIRR